VLVVSVTLARGFANLLDADPGFRSTNILTMRTALRPKYRAAADITRFYDSALQRISSIGGIRSAAAVTQLPLSGGELGSRFTHAPASPDDGVDADLRGITPRYFETLQIPIVAGRSFTSADSSNSPSVAIVDETFARHTWPGESALGKRIHWIRQPDRAIEIVGVVRGIRHRGLDQPPRETVYRPHTQYTRSTMSLVLKTEADAASASSSVLAAIHDVDADQPVAEVTTFASLERRSLTQPGFATGLAATLALIGLLLTLIGTYGLSSYSVAQRRREIGIRLALGAEPRGVVRMILHEGLRFALLGLAIGLPVSLMTARFVSARVAGATPVTPALLAVVACTMMLTMLAACWAPARRAARVPPSEPLRAE
jgi:predicted permease